MKHVLEPLSCIPGVRTAALVTVDGVPMAMHGARHASVHKSRDKKRGDDAKERASSERETIDSTEDLDVLAGLATSWMGEITRAIAPLSWDAPRQLVLRAARGTLIILQAPAAFLIVVLEGGMRAEELRLPMEIAVARMQRHLRSLGLQSGTTVLAIDSPPGIFPARSTGPASRADVIGPGALAPTIGAEAVHTTGNGVPEISGE